MAVKLTGNGAVPVSPGSAVKLEHTKPSGIKVGVRIVELSDESPSVSVGDMVAVGDALRVSVGTRIKVGVGDSVGVIPSIFTLPIDVDSKTLADSPSFKAPADNT